MKVGRAERLTEWAANGGIALLFQSTRLVAAVAELYWVVRNHARPLAF